MVEAQDKIICRCDEKQRKKAEKYLKGLGVEIILNEKIKAHNSQGEYNYAGSFGRIYSSKDYTIFMATGVKVNTILLEKSTNEPSLEVCLDKNDLIKVKPTLQLEHWKYNHIFAGGDATNVAEEKTAYAATLSGVCIARNICRIEKGKCPIAQGTKGLLSPPVKTLHGIKSNGGIGKRKFIPMKFNCYHNTKPKLQPEKLSFIEKKLSFLNPTWQMLKYFNEKQYFKIIQQASTHSNIIGQVPKVLSLPKEVNNNSCIPLSNSSCSSLSFDQSNTKSSSESSLLNESNNHINKLIKHGMAY